MANADLNNQICLAVLPLQLLTDDSRVQRFADGLIMDLITDLTRFRSFQIIAYDAVQDISPDEIYNHPKFYQLNLDYMIRGMVRLHRNRLQFNLQLINVKQNRLVWAEKFSGGFSALFQLQEEIEQKIVVSLQHFVDHDLLNEIRKKPLTHLNVYECWLKGYQELKKGNLEADEQARMYFKQAIKMDPHYPRAYTGMSLSYFNEWSCQLWSRWDVSRKGAFEWAQKALELDEWDHISHTILGRIHIFNGAYEKGEYYLRKSLQMNPNDAENLIFIAYGFIFLGYLQEAKILYERAQRLNPSEDYYAYACGALIHFEMGNIEQALMIGERNELSKGFVDFPAYMAAAYFMKGDMDRMHTFWDIFITEFTEKINGGKPADTITALQWMKDVNPYRGGTRLNPFWEYMSQTNLNGRPNKSNTAYPRQPNRFSPEGMVWLLSFNGKQIQISHRKGLQDIARLLSSPYQPIHCTDLMGAKTLEKSQPVFDQKARSDYQQRLLHLQDAIAEADAMNDDGRLTSLHQEYDKLLEHISRSISRNGKTRKAAGTIEKCRSAVTWRIRDAIKKIAALHPELARHLQISINTGVFCEYAPEQEIPWTF